MQASRGGWALAASRRKYPTVPHLPPAKQRRRSAPAQGVGVLIVDDQPAFLAVVRRLVESTPGFEYVGEATSGERAITLASAVRPDLVLMDVRMPGLGGLAAARCIVMARSASAVVLLSADPQDVPSTAVEECGAVAVVSKRHLRPASLTALWQRCQRAAQGPSQTSATSSTS
jgi:two-component system, NarL family, invasion response regulator UvrY